MTLPPKTEVNGSLTPISVFRPANLLDSVAVTEAKAE
jgi:hypothetical protein